MPPATPDAQQLKAALGGALHTPSASPIDADAVAEDLFLIASARGDELSAARRDELLDAVATDPGVAALLQDAHALAAAGSSATETKTEDLAPPPPTFRFPRTAVRAVFALAACLTVALGVWRFADPPATQVAASPNGLFNQPGMVVPSQAGDPPVDSVKGPTGTAPTLAAATSPRDSALIASVALTAVLGLALVLLTPGRKPDEAG